MTTTEPLLLNQDEVACLLGLGRATVYTLHRLGELRGLLIARHLRWRRADVEAFITRKAAAAEADR